jgi:hypothetical protein
MRWHRCHLFGEVFYLKPPSGPSQDPRPLCFRGLTSILSLGERRTRQRLVRASERADIISPATSAGGERTLHIVQVSTRTKPLALRTRRLDPLCGLC